MRRVFRIPFSTTRVAREVDDELAFHLETRIERLVADGWSPDAARREALRQFGDVTGVRDSMVALDEQRERSTRRADVASDLRQDIAYALRTLRRNAGVTAIIVGMLAVGIGANTAIFTLIDAVLVRALPVDRPEQLVAIGDPSMVNSKGRGSPHTDAFSVPLYHDLRDRNTVFSGLLASGPVNRVDVRVAGGAEVEHPHGRYVSGNFFSVLGVRPLYGRAFDERVDDAPGASPVVTIAHGYWARRFSSDPSVVGRTIVINGITMTIVGVTPPSFTGEVVGASTDVWLPISMRDALDPNSKVLEDREASWLLALGRLKPGVTLEQAQQQIKPLIENSILQSATPHVAQVFRGKPHLYYIGSGARGLSEVRETFQAPLFTLMIGVALVLCIICANVANLLLARAIARGREMAVRLALGANRFRLVRQLMTESAVLAALSVALGLVVAWWGSQGLLTLAADGVGIPVDLRIDLPVLVFTLGVSVVAVALFGLAPALRASRVDLAATMRAGARSVAGDARGRRVPLGATLIIGQVALSAVLLVGTAMLMRSLRNLESVDTGMDRAHLVMAQVDITTRGYNESQLEQLTRTTRDRLAALPGVAAVTFSENGIFSGTEWRTSVQVPGFTPAAPDDSVVATDEVGAGYAHGIGARIVAGRDMATSDEGQLPRVALVNQRLADFYFPGRSAVGQFLRFDDTVAVQIIGVMADTRDHYLEGPPRRRVYFPFVHRGDTASIGAPSTLRFAVRTVGPPELMVEQIRKTVLSVDAQILLDRVDPLVKLMRKTIREERLLARTATGFGLLALVLAAIGLYGVMTYAITRRTGEIGLRVALGAQRDVVVRMVLADALRLVGLGVVIGLPVALASTRLLRAQLHDVSTADPVSIVVAVVVLVASAAGAVALPALRASRVSPMEALRSE